MGVGLDVDIPQQSTGRNYPPALINFVPESKLRQQEDQKVLDNRPTPEPVTGLVAHVRGVFERHKSGRLDIEQAMLKTMRRINRIYEPELEKAIKAVGDPVVFTGHTTQAVSDAEAWIVDIINPDIDRTWDIEPTPISDLPGNIMATIRQGAKSMIVQEVMAHYEATGQMPLKEEIIAAYKEANSKIEEMVRSQAQEIAEEKSANMELTIKDQLVEGGWIEALKACISDMCNFKLCCMKGPIFRMAKTPEWVQGQDGEWTVNVTDRIRPEFSRVNPLDWYPSPDSIKQGDGDEIELEHASRANLQKLIGVPGYKTDVIKKIMSQYPTGYREMTVIEADRFLLEKQNTIGITNQMKYDIVNFWGDVPGQYLLDWGMTKEQIPDPDLDYKVNVKIVGSDCIKAVLNPDPLGKHPYSTTSYRKSNDSQWGESPGDMMEPVQQQLNLAGRALAKNLAWASAPIFEMDNVRCNIPGEVMEVWPGKTIISSPDQMGSGNPAVRMYDVPNKSLLIIRVMEKWESVADNTVVPSYGSASKGGDAGKTAQGLSMLRSDSARKLKLAIQNLDLDIIMPVIERLHMFNMKFLDKPEIKGDAKAKARGVMSVIAKEQIALRRQELLAMVIGSPVLTDIHGKKGIAYMAGESVKSAEMPIDKAIPNMDAIDKEPMNPVQPIPGGPTGQPIPVRENLDLVGNEQGNSEIQRASR